MELNRDKWTKEDYMTFIEYLKSVSDDKYKQFSDSLVPGIKQSFGVRVPILRSIAKEILKGNYNEFLHIGKGDYREEIMIEGLVMSGIKCSSYTELLSLIMQYAEKINSWETCDIVSFKQLKKYKTEFFDDIEYFIYNKNNWIVRYGFGCLMEFYLNDDYIDRVLKYVDSVNSDFYYVQMMQAWLIATAAAKCRDKTMAFLKCNHINSTTQNMAIRKIRESNRISAEDKEKVLNFKK